jgi:hypothetical protein
LRCRKLLMWACNFCKPPTFINFHDTKITLEFHFVTTQRTQLNTMLENDESFSTKSLDNTEHMIYRPFSGQLSWSTFSLSRSLTIHHWFIPKNS